MCSLHFHRAEEGQNQSVLCQDTDWPFLSEPNLPLKYLSLYPPCSLISDNKYFQFILFFFYCKQGHVLSSKTGNDNGNKNGILKEVRVVHGR